EDGGNENRYCDIALPQLFREIHLRGEPVYDSIRNEHEHHSKDGVDEVQYDDLPFHSIPPDPMDLIEAWASIRRPAAKPSHPRPAVIMLPMLVAKPALVMIKIRD